MTDSGRSSDVLSRALSAVERMAGTDLQLARSQATLAIGEVALALHRQGGEVSTPALIAALLSAAAEGPGLKTAKCAHAAQLLGWEPPPASAPATTSTPGR